MHKVLCNYIEINDDNIVFCFEIDACSFYSDLIMTDFYIDETDNSVLLDIVSAFKYKYAFYRCGMKKSKTNRITDYKGIWSLVGLPGCSGYSSFYDYDYERIYWGILEKKVIRFSRFLPLAICSNEEIDVLEIGQLLSGSELFSEKGDYLIRQIEKKHRGLCSLFFEDKFDKLSQVYLKIQFDRKGRETINDLLFENGVC